MSATPIIPIRRMTTKDGRTAIIRPAREEDCQKVHECNRAVVASGEGSVRSLEELDSRTEEKIREEFMTWIDGSHSGLGGCMLLAEMEGEIAGAGVIRRQQPLRVRHTAHIGIGIAPGWQGLGLGRAIMEGLIAWPLLLPGRPVTRVDLFVFAKNGRAIRLYESLGFVVEGTRRQMIRYEDGTYEDDLVMGLLLE